MKYKAYETSSAQRRIYIVSQLQRESIQYNMPTAKIIDTKLEPVRLEKTIKKLVHRHESLRTCFATKNGKILQIVHEYVDFKLKTTPLSNRPMDHVTHDFIRSFNLHEVPLWRIELIQLEKDRYLFLFDIHHIIADGISIEILFKEIMIIYQGKKLAPLDFQYVDFTQWQNDIFNSGKLKRQEAYWLNQFKGEIPLLALPTDYPRLAKTDWAGATIKFEIDRELSASLNQLAARHHTTLYVVLLASITVLLFKYTGQEDIVVGTPISGRPHSESEKIVGMFVNTMAMRNRPSAHKQFDAYLEEVSQNCFYAFENQDFQFEMLVEKLNLDRHLDRNPLFDTMLALQNFLHPLDLPQEDKAGLKFIPYPVDYKAAKFDLTLFAVEAGQQIYFSFEYRTSLFKRERITNMINHYVNILKSVTKNPGLTTAKIQILTEDEKKRLLYTFNNSEMENEYPGDKTIHQLFEQQVDKGPDRTAVVGPGLHTRAGGQWLHLTYKALNHRSNQLARVLRQWGVQPETIVGLLMDPSVERIAAILGILKAGGAYLPIAPGYPENRIATILNDCDVSLLLTVVDKVDNDFANIKKINPIKDETPLKELADSPVENLENVNQPGDLLYIISTSGSTGIPKNVMLEHRNLVNLLHFEFTKTGIDFSQGVLQFASIGFDVSSQEIFSALLAGGILYPVTAEMKHDIPLLFDFIERGNINIVFWPPALLKFIFSESGYSSIFPGSIQHIISAGEQLIIPDQLSQYLKQNKVYLHNHYGPSETHVVCSFTTAPGDEVPGRPPIGKPICNTRIFILDKQMNMQPIGVPGEIYISGESVGRGYYNRRDLTEEKFLENPFAMSKGQCFYRSGDVGRWLFDGNIEFLGRMDSQVKIRGFRVEPGEIESQLLGFPAVKEAVVIDYIEKETSRYLGAYIVAGEEIDTAALKNALQEVLPDYMIPSYVVQVEKIPLTPNGKVDRKALPEPQGEEIAEKYTPPGDDVEKKLVEIWADVLGKNKNKMSIDADFFELGGHSLKAMVLVSKVYKELDVKIPLEELFKRPKPRELSQYIREARQEIFAAIEPIEKKEYYALSAAQKRLFILQEMEFESTSYNIPVIVVLEGTLDIQKIQDTFRNLIKRHESLRTSFEMIGDKPIQRIHHDVHFEIEYYETEITTPRAQVEEHKGNQEASLHKEPEKRCPMTNVTIIENFIRPFDLSSAPLLRVGLMKHLHSPTLSGHFFQEEIEQKYILMVDMPHITADGISMNILIREFMAFYGGDKLPGLKIQYKDYSQWQNSERQREVIRKQEAFWLKEFSGEINVLNIPTDFPRPDLQSSEGNILNFEIGMEETGQIIALAKTEGISLFMLLLAVFNILLAKLSGQKEILIGSGIAGRRHPDLQQIVGMFVNMLPLRNYPEGSKTFTEFLEEVKGRALETFENQEYKFENLVEKVVIKRDASRNPLFDIVFQIQNIDSQPGEIPGIETPHLKLKPYRFERKISRYDISFIGFERRNLFFIVEYSTKLFKEETIQTFIRYFRKVLSGVLQNPLRKINEIEIISPEEKTRVLYDFNDTEAAYPGSTGALLEVTITRLFEEQVKKTPDSTAVVDEDERITYRELNKKANQLAHLLRSKGTTAHSIVGIMVDGSIDMIIGIFGILKAGGAYLPIDPDYPVERIKYMLQDCQASILLMKNSIAERHPFTGLQGLEVSMIEPEVTGLRPQINDLDNLPLPDRSLVNHEKYNQYIGLTMAKNTISMVASRGCPYRCAYCHKIWPKTHIVRSAENIFEELHLYYKIGIRRFAFYDDIFNLDKKNSMRFFQLIIKNKLDVQLFFPAGLRGDLLTKEYIDLMIKAGTINIAMALETASHRLQKLIGKNLNIEKLRENIEYICEKHPEVILELQLMHGFPTETEREAMSTLDFVKNIKWIHFPYIHILKIYSNTDMAKLAIDNGISREALANSENLAYHELPDTLPFDKTFTLKCQADFLNEYFLARERLLHVLPYQMQLLSEDEIFQKYYSYLPADINNFADFLQFVGITTNDLGVVHCQDENLMLVPNLNEKMGKCFPKREPSENSLKILLLDLSQFFRFKGGHMLYDVVEPPLGLMYLSAYLNRQFGNRIHCRILKSRVDFDNYAALKTLLTEFSPDVIGLRTLTFYRDFFHQTAALIRQWGFDVPIIAGGPYGTSDYAAILQDSNIDLVVLGEGEITFSEVIEMIIKNRGKLPREDILRKIQGVAFIPGKTPLAKKKSRQIILLDELNDALPREWSQDLEEINRAADLAYVIFTSGSTGKPKGVPIEHKSLVNLCNWHNIRYSVTSNDRATKFAGFGFDASIWEIFPYLISGASLHIINDDIKLDIYQLNKYFEDNRITISFLPTQICEQFMKFDNRSLRMLLTGGDRLKHFIKKQYLLMNNYGPTENTVVASSFLVNNNHTNIPIGKPIFNTQIYILDKNNNLQPLGVPGELCISGQSLARGYLNRPGLTADAFTLHPFGKGERMYRTGDLARWLADGNIEFLGRIDQQVKIRGARIELGEIETQLLKHDLIREALVTDREEEDKETYLCAYIVPKKTFDLSELKGYLSRNLPDSMIPTYFINIAEIPLTPNGKIDINALPVPSSHNRKASEKYSAPRNELEEKMLEIWSEVLFGSNTSGPGIGIDDNFFERGGHSLKATILISKIHKELNIKMPLTELFKAPTIRNLSDVLRNTKKDKYSSIKAVEVKEYYPLSSSQKRLYILQQMDTENMIYNIPMAMQIKGKPDKNRFQVAFQGLIKRHESLRTSFQVKKGEPVQIIHEEAAIEFKYMEAKETQLDAKIEQFFEPYQLDEAPLLRTALIRLAPAKHVLLFDMHHIISDGISMDYLVQDFIGLYKGEDLPELRIQYKDFSEWQNSQSQKEEMQKQERYWLRKFEIQSPVLNLPTDYQRPSTLCFEGSSMNFEIEEELTEKIKSLARETEATLFITLLTIFNILLFKYTGQKDIVIGTGITGRNHTDLEHIVGMFINTLPLRNELTGEKTVHEFLKEVKENTLSAFDNQDYHYEELVQKLGYERDPGRNPLFDVIFALQNIKISPLEIEGLGLALYPLGHKISKFDLTVMASEVRNRIELVYEYRSKLFKEETIRRMNRHFKNIIKEVVMNPRIKISRIEMMDDDEKAMLKKKIRYKRAPIFNSTKITKEKTLKIEAEFNF